MLFFRVSASRVTRFISFALIAAAAVSFNLPSAHSVPMVQGHGSQKLPFGEPGKASETDRTVGVYVDGMKYGLSATEFEAGETIRFVIVNSSPIAHEFILGDATTQQAHRRDMATRMKNGAMSGQMTHDDANAVFLKQGEVKEIIWKFSRPGKFIFACNIPGHFEAGMYGNLRVNG